MQDILTRVSRINRPSLLVRTARFAVDEYNRSSHLPRLIKTQSLPGAGEALMRLLDVEAEMNELRTADRAEYSFANHIDLLIAIMGEARLLRGTTRPTPFT